MRKRCFIYIFILSLIICTPPPPAPEPIYEPYVYPVTLVKNENESNSFKNLEDASQYFSKVNVVVNFLENGREEIHEFSLTTKNLGTNSYFPSMSYYMTLNQGESLTLETHTCYKLKSDGTVGTDENRDKCEASLNIENNKYTFAYKYKLYQDEFIIINQTYIIEKKTSLYKQESTSIWKMFSGGICDYKFIIPNNYKDLGLKYNIFKKESENIYYYKNDCPDVQINDIIRFAPIEKNWKANISLYLESTKIITYGKILFPRYYRGGKIRNKYYKIFTYDNIRLKESEIIDNEINLKAEFTLPNKTGVVVDF